MRPQVRFALDSPLEGDGFELPVPREMTTIFEPSCRDEDGERALGAAFDKGGAERVTRLYLRDDLPEDQCWLRALGWCLAYR